jgi:protein-tyrosine-phosphatase
MTDNPLRVLFLCTRNSARSQIAEALLARKGRDNYVVASAGTDPGDAVHPLAVDTLARVGIDWSQHKPQSIEQVAHEPWDIVITVCDRAHENCPTFPGRPVTAHWSLPDPAEVSEDRAPNAFWNTLNVLSRRIDLLIALGKNRLRELASDPPTHPSTASSGERIP